MITVRLKTSRESSTSDFKYEFEGRFVDFSSLPRRGELIRYDGNLYRVQDVLHESNICPVLYLWAHSV